MLIEKTRMIDIITKTVFVTKTTKMVIIINIIINIIILIIIVSSRHQSHNYGNRTLSIACITPFDATTFAIAIFEAVGLELPFTLAPPASVMVTVPPPAVAGLAPSVKSEENTLDGIT